MEELEEIINLLKKIFEDLLRTPIKKLEDFYDGKLFFEALNMCEQLDIPTDKCHRYELIQNNLNKFYDADINDIVDFEDMAVYHENIRNDVIRVCVLLHGMLRSYGYSTDAPICYLNTNTVKLLLEPTQPNLKNKTDRQNIHSLIMKVFYKDIDEFSNDQKISYSSVTDMTDYSRRQPKRDVSDDEVENSLNVPSFTSETGFFRTGIPDSSSCNINNDSINDSMNQENNSKESSKRSRRIRSLLPHRKSQLNSSYQIRKNNSPKINEFFKQELKNFKVVENENNDLRYELHSQEMKIAELEGIITKLNEDVNALNIVNRDISDEKDEFASKVLKNDQYLMKKDKEIEKTKNQLIISRKEKQEKIDEINQLKNNNEELNFKINSLNEKLKLKEYHYDELKLKEIEFYKINQGLEIENRRLKAREESYKREIQSISKGVKVNNQIEDISSPITENVGESMDIICEFKLAEIQDKMACDIGKYRDEVLSLKQEIESKNQVIEELKTQLEISEQKCGQSMVKINDREKLNFLELTKTDRVPDIRSMNLDNIIELLTEMFSFTHLSLDERELLMKSMRDILNVTINAEKGNHQRCQDEIKSLYKNQAEMKQNIELKIRNYESLEKELCHYHELYEVKEADYEDLTRYSQVQQAKFDEDYFKLKRTYIEVDIEKNKKIHNLNKELSKYEDEIVKSRSNYINLRENYDDVLHTLKKLIKDCHDYEEIIKEITERDQITYANVSCQTEFINSFISTGTNVMSPRIPATLSGGQNHSKNYNNLSSRHEVINNISSRNNDISFNTNSRRQLYNDEYNDKLMSNHKSNNSKFIYEPVSYVTPYRLISPVTNKINPKLVDELRRKAQSKQESPLVKKERIGQMLSRNQKQPDHLKSSYPVETQGIEVGYMASVLFDSMKVPLDNNEIFEEDYNSFINTNRSNNSRRYTNVDSINFRADGKVHGVYESKENALADDLIKFPYKAKILNARSTNFNENTSRNQSFMKPRIPQLNLSIKDAYNHNNDIENVKPLSDIRDGSLSSAAYNSTNFDILNSPKVKQVGYPRGRMRKDNRGMR